ncbi:MAG: hypothetical protein ACRD8U_07135 [Pyrinomonadaceae bacterium]
MVIILFIIAKLALYTFWCWFGIRLLTSRRKNAPAIAFGLACLRLVLGFALGIAWAYSVSFVAPNEEYSRIGFDPLTFIIGFLVLRLLLWSGMSLLIRIGTGGTRFWGWASQTGYGVWAAWGFHSSVISRACWAI